MLRRKRILVAQRNRRDHFELYVARDCRGRLHRHASTAGKVSVEECSEGAVRTKNEGNFQLLKRNNAARVRHEQHPGSEHRKLVESTILLDSVQNEGTKASFLSSNGIRLEVSRRELLRPSLDSHPEEALARCQVSLLVCKSLLLH